MLISLVQSGRAVGGLEGFDSSFKLNERPGGECALGRFNFTLELAEGAVVLGDVCTSRPLVLLDNVLDDAVVEVLITRVDVPSGGEDLEDAVIDGREGGIEISSTRS